MLKLNVSKIATLILALTLPAGAQASSACVDQGVSQIKSLLASRASSSNGIALAPALAYEGLTQAQLNGSGRAQGFINTVGRRVGVALEAFLQAQGTREDVGGAVAQATFGSAQRRQLLQVLRRPMNSPAAVASTANTCNSRTCADMALKTEQIFIVDQMRQSVAAEIMSVFKFASDGAYRVFYCAAGSGCRTRNDVMRAGGVVNSSNNPSPAIVGQAYLVREAMNIPFIVNFETTSLVQSTALTICGQPATLMTAIVVRGENAFDNGSTVSITIEKNNRSMVFTKLQAYVAGNRGSVPGSYLDGNNRAITGTSNIYNDIAGRLRLADRVGLSGVLR